MKQVVSLRRKKRKRVVRSKNSRKKPKSVSSNIGNTIDVFYNPSAKPLHIIKSLTKCRNFIDTFRKRNDEIVRVIDGYEKLMESKLNSIQTEIEKFEQKETFSERRQVGKKSMQLFNKYLHELMHVSESEVSIIQLRIQYVKRCLASIHAV